MAELDAKDIERILQIGALVTQGILEMQNILANKGAQKLRTEEGNFDHAEIRNKKARELIDAL